MGVINENDTLLQMARCSWDMYMQEIIGTLIIGASVILLHPQGNMDIPYLVRTLSVKQITYIHCVPSYLNALCHYFETRMEECQLRGLRSLCISGRYISSLVA